MLCIEFASVSATRHPSKSFEFTATQSVEPLVSGRVLDKTSLVAEPVVAVLSHAVEVGLVFSVVAALETAVLVESESHVALGNGFIFEHSHRRLQPHLFLV